jgi:hypothetical protein
MNLRKNAERGLKKQVSTRRPGRPRFCCSLAEPRQQVDWKAEPSHPSTALLQNRTVDRALGARKCGDWLSFFACCHRLLLLLKKPGDNCRSA